MNETSPCYPIEHLYFYHFFASLLSPLPLLSFIFISASCTGSQSCSLPSSNKFFLVRFIFIISRSLPFVFLLPVFLFFISVLASRLFEDMVRRRVSGHWRTFRSRQRARETAWSSCTHAHTHIHAQIQSHTPVLSSRIPLKEFHSHKARCHREKKQRDGIFFLHPLRSFSFSPPLAVVFSGALQCSTNMPRDQRVWGVRSEGQLGTRVEGKMREVGSGTELSIKRPIKLSGACMPVAHLWTSELTWGTIGVP